MNDNGSYFLSLSQSRYLINRGLSAFPLCMNDTDNLFRELEKMREGILVTDFWISKESWFQMLIIDRKKD